MITTKVSQEHRNVASKRVLEKDPALTHIAHLIRLGKADDHPEVMKAKITADK